MKRIRFAGDLSNKYSMQTAGEHIVSVESNFRKRPLLISGPCSAETREQLIETARQVAGTGMIDLLRAGIWKPRTRPGSFEGVGVVGLEWLQEAKQITGLPTTVE